MRFYELWDRIEETQKVNTSQILAGSGGSQVIDCMRRSGAKVINVYKLLLDIGRGVPFNDAVFLGLEQDNKLLAAIANLAGGIHWQQTKDNEIMTPAHETKPFLEEIIRRGKRVIFCVPNIVDAVQGFTHQEWMWFAKSCNNRKIMGRTTIVVGLYSVIGEEELQSVLDDNKRVDVVKLKELLSNWRTNLSPKGSTPGYVARSKPTEPNPPVQPRPAAATVPAQRQGNWLGSLRNWIYGQ